MDYGALIRDAFRITLRNRFLWFFGLFVGGTASNIGGNAGSRGGNLDQNGLDQSGAAPSQVAAQIGQGVFESAALVVGAIAVVALIVLFFVAMGLISQGALAESVAAIERGERRRFGSAFRTGFGNLLRVLGFSILFFLIALGLLAAIGIPLALLVGGAFAVTESVGARVAVGVVAALVGIVLFIVVFVPLGVIQKYALREVVVRRERILGSVGSGYGIFRRNVGSSLLLWLIGGLLRIGVLIALVVALLIVGVVLFLPTIGLAAADLRAPAVVAGAVAGLILVPLVLAAFGAAGAFSHSYWTLAYLRLTGRPAPASAEAPAPTDPPAGPSYG